jgi:hypothetical protein
LETSVVSNWFSSIPGPSLIGRLWTLAACLLLALMVSEFLSGAYPVRPSMAVSGSDPWDSVRQTASKIDGLIEKNCQTRGVPVAPLAEMGQVARRIALSLHGRIPSLTDIRQLEGSLGSHSIERLTDRLLAEKRFGDYLGEWIANTMVREQESDVPFPYRRETFVTWLTDQVNTGVPYDRWVREIVTADGLWSQRGAANFITNTECSAAELAAQTARSFLGLRLDCAQCHDHPFASWKQGQFHGLAAYFANIEADYYAGLKQNMNGAPYEFKIRKTQETRQAEPKPPFRPDLDPGLGERRERLATWLTHRDNPYFARAMVNRIWMLMFGRGLIEPIDDMEKPERIPEVLGILAEDFKDHDFDIRRLIRIIVSTRAFQRQSSMHTAVSTEQEDCFAAFPITRIRPEPLSHALSQVLVARPIDRSANVLTRWLAYYEEERFSRNIGKPREDEVLGSSGSLTQRLALLNGTRLQEELGFEILPLSTQVAALASSDDSCVEVAFLTCLSRRPLADEREYFARELAGTKGTERAERVADLFWCLTNASEFSWNH